MSEPKNVLVAVGQGPTPRVPRQSYDSIVTKYNIANVVADYEFFNRTIKEGIVRDPPVHVYGFLKGGHYYSSPSSLEEITDIFNMGDKIEIVTTDILIKKPRIGAEFIEYYHSESILDTPFFVKDSIIDQVRFEDSDEVFKNSLENLVRSGKKIYHIGEPLLTLEVGE